VSAAELARKRAQPTRVCQCAYHSASAYVGLLKSNAAVGGRTRGGAVKDGGGGSGEEWLDAATAEAALHPLSPEASARRVCRLRTAWMHGATRALVTRRAMTTAGRTQVSPCRIMRSKRVGIARRSVDSPVCRAWCAAQRVAVDEFVYPRSFDASCRVVVAHCESTRQASERTNEGQQRSRHGETAKDEQEKPGRQREES
jgi:hypothetical protein